MEEIKKIFDIKIKQKSNIVFLANPQKNILTVENIDRQPLNKIARYIESILDKKEEWNIEKTRTFKCTDIDNSVKMMSDNFEKLEGSIMKKIIGYVAVIAKTEDKKYYVEFPDLLGCYTQGDSLEMAICNAQEALAIYYREKAENLPKATELNVIKSKISQDKIAQIIAIDTSKYIIKSMHVVKKTLTIPEWLNILGEKYRVNFSKVLKNALISYLKNLNVISTYDRYMLDQVEEDGISLCNNKKKDE